MASINSSFRATQWDPVLILSQIVCLQSIWYISISTIVFTLFKFSGADITLDAILNYREIRADNAQGMLLGLAWLLNSAVGVYLLLKIVSRARLVLDFSLTLLLYHVLATTLYSDHVPTTFLWWALNGTTCGIMIFGGEYVCMQQEMEPILLGNGSAATTSTSNSANIRAHSAGGASLATTLEGPGFDEATGLMMEVFESNPDSPSHTSGPVRSMPQKARSSEDAGLRFSPAIRSSVLGNQNHGRQRTSDRYEMVPTAEVEGR